MTAPPQPNQREPIADKDGRPAPSYIKFFSRFTAALQAQISDLSAALASILALQNTTGGLAASKADKTTRITGNGSLIGGGDLSSDKAISLLNDADAPGADMVYGTDSGGTKGWKADPASGASTAYVDAGDAATLASAQSYADAVGAAIVDGVTFTGDISVPDEAYDATAWNGSLEVPTKNAVRDKIETLGAPAASAVSITDSGGYFTGTDVEAALQELGAAGGGGGGISSGTSNPGSPSTNDLFYRTDLGLLIYYDGTRWLTVAEYPEHLYIQSAAISVNGNVASRGTAATVNFNWWITRFAATTFVSGTNNGTSYWTVNAHYLDSADAATNIASFNTSADSSGAWTRHEVAVGAALNSAARCIGQNVQKVSSPGTIIPPATLYYRLIVT